MGSTYAVIDQLGWAAGSHAQPTKTLGLPNILAPAPRAAHAHGADVKVLSSVLDKESVSLVKSYLTHLPNPHEEFDINFSYQFWAPEINTTRRSDHSARFKTT